jgi:predicted ATPase
MLDEPEAALSPNRQLAFLRRLHDLTQDGSQFVIATHSPIILAYPNSVIIEFTENGLAVKKYDELAHVQLTKTFLDNPERMMRMLFE